MATWKKVIVSGSAAELASLSLSTALTVPNGGTGLTTLTSGSVLVGNNGNAVTFRTINGAGNIVATSAASGLSHSGSVSGSFQGDGSGLTGVVLSNSLTAGSGLSGTAFNGSAAQTWTVNSGSMLPFYSSSIFGTVSGDILITAGGVATIQANAVALGSDTTGDYVSNVIAGSGMNTTGASTGEGTSHTLSVNSGSMLPYYSGSIFSTVSGDITIGQGGVSAIGTGKVTSTMILDDTIVNADINSAAGIVYTKLNLASSGIVSGSQLNTSTTQGTVVNVVNGVSQSAALLNLGTTGNPTFNNLTVSGDLVVNGNTTTINTNNLAIEDRFIILNVGSGSIAPAAEGGIIVEGGTAGSGQALYYDGNDTRWAVNTNATGSATALTATAYMSIAYSGTTANATSAGFDKVGNITADGTDIWIYG